MSRIRIRKSAADDTVTDYLARLKRALAPLPRGRRGQILDDVREHVTAARGAAADQPDGAPVREILERLGTPESIAAAALDGVPRQHVRRLLRTHRHLIGVTTVVLIVAAVVTGVLTGGSPQPVAARTTAAIVPDANSDCSPQSPAASSPAATLTSHAVQVASGTVAGQNWSLWSAKGQKGATGLEDGGLIIGGRAYGLCPGYPNPAELEVADIGTQGIVYGVVGYPGLAKIQLYTSTVGTFDRGTPLPAPGVQVVKGVSFFIGTLPRSACDYPALELNTTSVDVSAEHNLGFGRCTAGDLVPISASQGIWQLSPGQFPANFPSFTGRGRPDSPPNSDCFPVTSAAASGGLAATLTARATEVASGTVAGQSWSLWSAKGQKGANGLEEGGLVIDGRAYGLCPGFPNPAELEMADTGSHAIVYGVVGYTGHAKVQLYTGRSQSFTPGPALPAPSVQVVDGVSFFIGTLPKSACDYPWLELNSAVGKQRSQHNLGFGSCTANRLVPITSSMGQWTINP
jgi:hypothetical protein